jgi:hypothetical protein
LAHSTATTGGRTLVQGNRQIFYSAETHYGFRHRDHRGRDAGKSVEQGNDRIDHFSPRDEVNRIGFDTILRSARIIRHFDKNGEKIGETQVNVEGNQGEIVADEALADYLEVFSEFDERCPAATRQRDVYNSARQRCGEGNDSACERVPRETELLRSLEQECQR